jgi:hypothetical protein
VVWPPGSGAVPGGVTIGSYRVSLYIVVTLTVSFSTE